MSETKKILAIDPGTKILGWCAISGDKRQQNFIDGGILKVSASKTEIGLKKIFDGIMELVKKFSPDFIAIESPFYGKNAKTLIRLGEARGAILLAAATSQIPIFQITPAEAKLALTGNGNAQKEQVAYMVRMILNVRENLPIDATDAAAVGIAFFHKLELTG